jgi:hypothetical protein
MMQCGQGKPFTVTSTNPKMGNAIIKSYEKGGEVTKPKVQTMPNRNPQGDKPKIIKTPNPKSIAGKIQKYSPTQYEALEKTEQETERRGKQAVKDFEDKKYGSAAVNVGRGLASAADTLLVTGPKAAADALRNRITDGKK